MNQHGSGLLNSFAVEESSRVEDVGPLPILMNGIEWVPRVPGLYRDLVFCETCRFTRRVSGVTSREVCSVK